MNSKRVNTSKRGKKEWLKGMRKLYPEFKAKMWGRPSYRFKHPQP